MRNVLLCAVAAGPSDTRAPHLRIIGDNEKPWWDAIIVVEYRSPAVFLDIVTNEQYLKIHGHRANVLDRGDLIATSTWTMAD